MVERWDTPDFFEFDRVFKCSRVEFIYLIKGFAFDKLFSITIQNEGTTRSYRLITFRCTCCPSDVDKPKRNKWNMSTKCPFYLQYVETPDERNVYRLHSFYQ